MNRLLGRIATSLVCVAALVAVANLALAMEPTPTDPIQGEPDVTTNAAEPVATRIIIKYVESEGARVGSEAAAMNAADRLSTIAGANIRHVRVMSGNAQVVELTDMPEIASAQATEIISSIVERLEADPMVEYAELDAFMQIQQAVNDPQFGQQWHYTTPGTGMNVVDGWANATGTGVVVAVIDTGYRPHADLAGNLLLPGFDFISNTIVANDGDGRDADARDPGDWIALSDAWCPRSQHPRAPFDSSWHGTHVAGTVAAVTNNSRGVAGVARSAKVVPVRVLGKCGGNLSDIADGMRWAAGLPVPSAPTNTNPAKVLNLSLGGGGACGPTYQNAINAIVAAGATVVVAAGNSNANASGFRPANCNGVVTVAATNQVGARSYYSNFGGVVEIAAPGGETHQVRSRGVLSTLNTGTTTPSADSYAFYQGTSMAAPHVAGVAALLYQLSPGITPAQVSTVLQDTAQSFPTASSNQCNTANCGAGIVDAGAATGAVSPVSFGQQAMPWLKLLLMN
ncbi:MAG: S8 family peptidase [Gammaproteobacteria bacterium]|nr:S8 family peptidase [Gammaproteobacteria bacterium]